MARSVIPLESNPEVFNSLAQRLGLSPVVQFHDVYSISDPDLLAFLPQPVYAIIMLFPITEGYENHRRQQDSTRPSEYRNESFDQIKWFKQTINNACGLYALLHILTNLPPGFIIENLILQQTFIRELKPELSQQEFSKMVDMLEQNILLDSNFGSLGQTEAPDPGSDVNFHFITFVKGSDGHIYELDGRRKGPVDLGPSDETHILNDEKLVNQIQFYMDNTDEENRNNFALMAVAPSMD